MTAERQSAPVINLSGRIALVTGAAKRVGRALAFALGRAGAHVVIHYRSSADQARKTASLVEKAGSQAALVQGDLADPAVPAHVIETAAEFYGPLDILVNNASVFAPGAALQTTLADWDLNQAVNLRAPFLLSQAFAGQLPEDKPGDVINLNDWRALRPGADHFAYTISKVGLHGLTKSLALALAPRIKVNELALGAVLPPEKAPEDYLHSLKAEIPSRRFSNPEEVAQAMLFLLTNPSVHGQTVCIDGGRHLV